MSPRITAVLGPTNTGKTHYAIERMLAHRTGVIGLPLRLLAREVYDRLVALRGPSVVALVTGEERIVPPRTQYWVATVEAMPEGLGPDFLAIDEIQLAADPERGHVFTDRLLNARGQHETLFLGSDTMRRAIAALVPKVTFLYRERFSQLTYTGSRKISRMAPRSAIVGFSVEGVYAIAELLRRQKGGAAVVMGALSPRTRNAQVEMYQSGEVDHLVATDAIGMGLNLDIDHVAFSGLRKFDGRRMRELAPNELAQIAGRAGRFTRPGTWGVTGEARPLRDEVVAAIEAHSFTPVKKLQWRSAALDFGSVPGLIASLEAPSPDPWLARAREADDLMALKALGDQAEVAVRATEPARIRLLWDVCRIPDFRGISHQEHAGMLQRIFSFLVETGEVPDDFLARQIRRIDQTSGDIDTISRRLAFIRTWTYVAQRKGWVAEESHWRQVTRDVEDRLSDALHLGLMARFVDRRTSVLLRRLKEKEGLVAEVNDKGEVTVEGEVLGRLEGFRFRQDASASGEEARAMSQAAEAALAPQFHLRADRFYNAPDTEMDITEQGGLMWGDQAVGRLAKGDDALKPRIVAFVDDAAGPEVAEKVARRLGHFVERRIAALFEPLTGISRDESLTGLARGFGFRMVENFGIIDRREVAGEVRELDQDARGALRRHKVRFGQFTIFMPDLLKPAPTRLRLVLWSLWKGLEEHPESPPPGLVTVPVRKDAPEGYHLMAGYRPAGDRAIRIDMLERLADQLRAEDSRGGFEAKADMLSITGMTLEQFANLMEGLGYRAERGERKKARPAKAEGAAEVEATQPPAEVSGGAPEIGATGAAETEARPDAVSETSPADGSVEGTSQAGTPDPESIAVDQAEAAEAPGEVAGATPGSGDEGAAQTEARPDAEAGTTAQGAEDEGASPVEAPAPTATGEVTAGEATSQAEAPASENVASNAAEADSPAAPSDPETEVFYTFTWAGNRGRGGGHPRGEKKAGGGKPPRGKGKPRGKPGPKDGGKPRKFEARPPKREKAIDPDNPFAQALMGLKKGD